MARKKKDPLQRLHLDQKLSLLRNHELPSTPHGGWIRNLREALGMSREQLATRLKITPQSLADIEAAEAEDRITLATLKRVAAALNADLRLAIVPALPLAEMLQKQARKVATEIVSETQASMALEAQGNSKDFVNQRIEELANELVRSGDRRIWNGK